MDDQVDHYVVLGLPSGEEGAKLSTKAISQAYRDKALVLHPDKRPGDKNANADFQQLAASRDILMNDKTRKSFDDHLRRKRCQRVGPHQSQRDSKLSDLVKRERRAPTDAHAAKAREEEEERRRYKKFLEEIDNVPIKPPFLYKVVKTRLTAKLPSTVSLTHHTLDFMANLASSE